MGLEVTNVQEQVEKLEVQKPDVGAVEVELRLVRKPM